MCQNLCTYAHIGEDRSIGAVISPGTPKKRSLDGGVNNAERKCLPMKSYARNAESPCLSCYMVADPQSCNNSNCLLWQRWFAARWRAARQSIRQQYQQIPLEEVGVIVGGIRYAPPHRRREFLSKEPCRDCRCPKELCRGDCRLRGLWLAGKQEVPQ